MGRFSSKLLAIVTDTTLGIHDSFNKLANFLDISGVSQETESSVSRYNGKLTYLRGVLECLNTDAPEVLQDLIARLARDLGGLGATELWELRDTLRAEGFELADDGTVTPAEILPEEVQETKDRLRELLVESEADVSLVVLSHHLDEHDRLYREGHYGSSASEARNFVEQLLQDLAKSTAAQAGESKSLSRPVEVRKYLECKKFFDKDERKRLVNGVYGYLSNTGSHPGVTDVTVGRMARVIFLSFAVYTLEKWQSWKSGAWTP